MGAVTTDERRPDQAPLAERFGDFLTSWVDRVPLPPRLHKLLTRELVGFAILGGFTYLIDLALLYVLNTTKPLPIGDAALPVYVGFSFVTAFALNFVLNRTLNFKSHAPVGGQAMRFGFIVALDLTIAMGGTTLMATVFGFPELLARVTAGACEAAITYPASRFWVFRDTLKQARERDAEQHPASTG